MMRQMRDNMKAIMLVTAIAFVGLMVFGWGMDITGRSGTAATGGELGRVNDEPITYEEWNVAYRNLYEQQQRQQPGQPINAALTRQLEEAAWEQLLTQKLVNQELRRRNIEVTESELRQAARFAPPPEFMSNPMFQTNGQFDPNKYAAFLSSPQVDNQMLLQLEAYYRDIIPRSKLFYEVTSGTYIPDSELWRIFRDARETATVKFVAIDPNQVVADAAVTVPQREVEKYYKEHKEEFKRPAAARIRYLTVSRAPTAEDSARALARVRAVRQAALTDFAKAASSESADSVSRKAGGVLGKVRRGMTVPAFEQAVFAQPVGQVGEPVLSQFGYHIIKVTSRTADEAEASHILIPIERSPEAEERLLDYADSLETLGENMSLAEVARTMNLRVREGDVNDAAPFLAPVGQADDVAQWAFREGAEIGEVSPVFETPGVYYLAELVSKTDEGIPELKQVAAEIEHQLKLEKKVELAKPKARAVLERIRRGQSFDAAVAAERLGVQNAGPFTRIEMVPGMGRANAAIGTAFGLKPGQVSDIVVADNMLFIIQLVEKKEADRAEFEAQKAQQRERTTPALAEQRWNMFLAALREDAKIVDNRAELRRQAAANPAPVQPF
ncbi:MAG TPA: peptidyl-prolyl cis-trans isomerase [Longimicrobiales bacterium]